jgi:hypothetical protein
MDAPSHRGRSRPCVGGAARADRHRLLVTLRKPDNGAGSLPSKPA